MALDAYSPCPCGSGKKFKWCCQPIHVEMDKAFQQDAGGQHDAALRIMDQVVAAHPGNPEAWGRKAELLYRNGQAEQAEEALQKAFDINPSYPFGNLLRGLFRHQEGEIPGALLLFRRAAEAYDPEARDHLAQVFALIAECELKLNRPIATRAALQLAIHFQPASEELRQALEGYFGEKSRLPAVVRREYKFQPASAGLPADRQAFWDQALATAATGKLSDAAKAFDQVAQRDPNNAPAWYNLALARAWLGDNAGALDALDHYLSLESDEAKAAEAWTLGEALRLGHGMEPHTDFIESSAVFQVRDAQGVSAALQKWQNERRLLILQAREDEPVFSGLILERQQSLTVNPAEAPPPRLGAYLLIVADRLRIWNTSREAFDRTREELQQRAGAGLSGGQIEQTAANFNDVLAPALVFPIDVGNKDEAERLVRQNFERYFEDNWIHKPLRSLGGVPPVDAAGHGTLRKKLLGVVAFLEQCAKETSQPYDFDRLRRKLGLSGGQAEGAPRATGPDIRSMGVAELAGLSVEALAADQLEQAFQTAMQLDARDVAGKFAQALVARSPQSCQHDPFPWYSHLASLALVEGKTDAALKYLSDGEQADASANEGKRRNDYLLRRGQIHAKRGEADLAQEAFDRLVEAAPSELRYRGSAAEAMLSARQGARALRFAEGGLAQARQQNNRDSEQYFLELTAAARKISD